MSSDHDHGESDGAHEIDKMPYARLFNLLVGLAALTLLACIGVIQVFNMQVRQIVEDYAAEGEKDSLLTEYRGEAAQVAAGYGRFEFELEGKVEERFFEPLAAARKQVVEDPKLLDGADSYRGWEDSPVGKQIKDWGGLPKPKPAEPRKRPGPDADGAPADGKAPAPEKPEKPDEGKAEEGKAEEGKAEEGKAGEGKAEEGKAEEGKAEEGKAEEGKAEEGKAKGQEGKGRRGKSGTGTGTGTARPSAGEAKAGG